jgi:hypothetical protein
MSPRVGAAESMKRLSLNYFQAVTWAYVKGKLLPLDDGGYT